MKKTVNFLCAALALAAVVGCDEKEPEVVDFPVVGDLSISGRYVNYLHGSQGWVEEDKIGVFVTSDGVEQANLLYEPSEVCPIVPGFVDGMFIYDSENPVDGDILLNPAGTAAGFKQGEHNIYAYTPYSEGNTTYSSVKLPKTDVQEYIEYDGLHYLKGEYMFAYAKLAEPVTESTSATLSLGDFVSPFVMMTIPSATLPEACVNKKVTKIVVSAAKDIAVSDASVNLETGEMTGTFSKSIELDCGDGILVEGIDYGFGMMVSMSTIYLSLFMDFDEAQQTEFTFTYTIDGQDYTTTGSPSTSFVMEGNVNMSGALDFTE